MGCGGSKQQEKGNETAGDGKQAQKKEEPGAPPPALEIPSLFTAPVTREAPFLDEFFKAIVELDAVEQEDVANADPVKMLEEMQKDPKGFQKRGQEKQEARQKMCAEKTKPILEKAFEKHDTSKDGVLDMEESKIFFEDFMDRYRTNAKAIYLAHERATQEGSLKIISDMLQDNPEGMKTIQDDFNRKIELQGKFVEEAFQEYAKDKDKYDKAAFDKLDVNKDGKLVKEEVVNNLVYGSSNFYQFLEAFPTGPMKIATAIMNEAFKKLMGDEC